MELKSYQKTVIANLDEFLHYIQKHKSTNVAFNTYWEDKIGVYNPLMGTGMKPYQNSVPGSLHVCIKVPTAGGKTFIACNALHTIFSSFSSVKPKAVVWLVPWSNLLSQTVNNLSDPTHPYREKLNSLFNSRVEVYQKKDLLQGSNFSPTVIADQLSIFVLSFASVRAKNKDERKIFEENGQLAQFSSVIQNPSYVLPDTDETALINVIRSFEPVVIVDESHNAESELSTDMLQNLNPSFILDLTATPKDKSNIISFVNALELKKEHMVKLPVIVYNHQDKNEVIGSALHLQRKLELLSDQEVKQGGKYIRPIVLFQAQPRTKDENIDFKTLKNKLLALGIPEEHIKIKTAEIDELKGIDLMDRFCEVRYIITVNALKEGWDCPFAYILASLADKSSAVDVEQILGRVLRQPYVMKHQNFQLNLSYVLTASTKFNETLQNIVQGLQNAGFSKNDYRSVDKMPEETKSEAVTPVESFLFPEQQSSVDLTGDEIDTEKINFSPSGENSLPTTIDAIEILAQKANDDFEKQVDNQLLQTGNNNFFAEIPDKVKQYKMRESIIDIAKAITLPQFFIKAPKANLFFEGIASVLLHQEALLEGFRLSSKDADINFESIKSDLYKVDLEEVRTGEYSPKFIQIDDAAVKEPLVDYILAKPQQEQIKDIANVMVTLIGNMYPIADQEIRKYVERVIADMNPEQLQDFLVRKYSYSDKLKKKIKQLADEFAEKRFKEMLQTEAITLESNFQFYDHIVPGRLGSDIAKSLYEREGEMNGFESSVISNLASLPNLAFWHRNLGRGKGFAINGFKSNHYPDFILVTKAGKIILLETKGDDRDNSDSAAKNRLGIEWSSRAGSNFRYFMVFENNNLLDAYSVQEVKDIIKQL
ncbi:MAG: DEAD/DEAH box helicase [Daejeonella sp.]